MTIDFAIQNVSSVQKHVSAKVSCTPESSPETPAGLPKACLVNLSFIPVSDDIEESTTISEDDAFPKQSVVDEPTAVVPPPSKMYHLFHRKVKVFYATLNNRSDLIHGQNLKEGEWRFLTKNTYCRGQAKWSGYKPDVNLQGTWIAWKMEEAREHIPRERIAVEATSEATDLTGPEEVEEGRGRRRKRNEDKYSTNIRVKKRAIGESYSPCHKEAARVPAREMKSPCPNSCRRKCSVRFNEDERKGFFDAYWALAEYKKQRVHLQHC